GRDGWAALRGRWLGEGSSQDPVPAMANGGGGARAAEIREPLFSLPQDFIAAMSAQEPGSNPANTTPLVSGRERGIRNDIQPTLKPRSGKTPEDRFEPSMTATEILEALGNHPIAAELNSRVESEDGVEDAELGAALGEALEQRLVRIARHER